MNNLKIYILLILLVSAVFLYSAADTIFLKNGGKLDGNIISDSGDKVIIDTGVQEIHIQRAQIDKIETKDPGENNLITVSSLLENGSIKDVLDSYEEIVKPGFKTKITRNELLEKVTDNIISNEELLLIKLKTVPPESIIPKLDIIFKNLNTLKAMEKTKTDNFFFLQMKAWFILNDLDKAVAAFVKISATPDKMLPEDKKLISRILKEKLKYHLLRNEFEQAMEYVEHLNKVDPITGHNTQILVYLDLAGRARKKGDFKEALNIYINKLKPVSPYIADERIKAAFAQLTHSAIEKNEYEDAIQLWEEHGEKSMPQEAAKSLKILYEKNGDKLLKTEDYTAAKINFQKAQKKSPDKDIQNKDIQKKIDLADYCLKSEKISADDFDTHYRLAEYCVEKELYNEAVNEFKNAEKSPKLSKNAKAQIEVISEKVQISIFKDAMARYEENDFIGAMDKIYELLNAYPESKLRADMENLRDICQKTIKTKNYEAVYQADVYFQEAERFFFTGDYPKALQKCSLIIQEFTATPAAQKAKILLPSIKNHITFDYFETSGFITSPEDSESTASFKLSNESSNIEKELKDVLDIFKDEDK